MQLTAPSHEHFGALEAAMLAPSAWTSFASMQIPTLRVKVGCEIRVVARRPYRSHKFITLLIWEDYLF